MKIQELIGSSAALPSIPKVAQELIEDFSKGNVSIGEISQKMEKDPALTAKLLRLANSARYARNRSVESVEQAAVLIGDDALKTLIIATGVSSAFKGGDSLKPLWLRSFTIAEALKSIALEKDLDMGTAFTLGILHNVGEILIAVLKPEMYKYYLQEAKFGESRKRLEMKTYGVLSADVGAELSENWRFPVSQVTAIASQMALDESKDVTDWGNLIFLTTRYLEAIQAEKSDDLDNSEIKTAIAKLGMTHDQMVTLMNESIENGDSYLDLL